METENASDKQMPSIIALPLQLKSHKTESSNGLEAALWTSKDGYVGLSLISASTKLFQGFQRVLLEVIMYPVPGMADIFTW